MYACEHPPPLSSLVRLLVSTVYLPMANWPQAGTRPPDKTLTPTKCPNGLIIGADREIPYAHNTVLLVQDYWTRQQLYWNFTVSPCTSKKLATFPRTSNVGSITAPWSLGDGRHQKLDFFTSPLICPSLLFRPQRHYLTFVYLPSSANANSFCSMTRFACPLRPRKSVPLQEAVLGAPKIPWWQA